MPRRYLTEDEDSARWDRFSFRPGDVVISTRSKSGTTWMQMICALLVFGSPELPGRLHDISPWLDWRIQPIDEVLAALEAQTHRRVIKTHTPLDGVPIVDDATYIVVARHPLDCAISMYHQGLNLDRVRLREMIGDDFPLEVESRTLDEFVSRWIEWSGDPRDALDTLSGISHHVSDAWSRRKEPNVVLSHYADLQADLSGEMRRVAGEIEVDVDEESWDALVEAAGFSSMKKRAEEVAPGAGVALKSADAFFRSGTVGRSAELADATLNAFAERAAALLDDDLAIWLNRP